MNLLPFMPVLRFIPCLLAPPEQVRDALLSSCGAEPLDFVKVSCLPFSIVFTFNFCKKIPAEAGVFGLSDYLIRLTVVIGPTKQTGNKEALSAALT